MVDRAFDGRGGLRHLRTRAMMTQEELSSESGVGIRTIRDIESGRVRPQPKTLRLLAEALGLEAEARDGLAAASDRGAAKPRELPRSLDVFSGREDCLNAIFAAVDDGAAVITLHGMAGVGKTSLAVRAAHALASRYPDGQLFVDLHGFTHSTGARPGIESVLTRLLRSLDAADGQLPSDLDELAARYRSAVADRRVLLVLDNAADAERVEPLLPGMPGSLVLTTSRRDLSSLAGAFTLSLEPPPIHEAAAMLDAAVAGRITEEEAVVIAERCGRLPLALGLAAARLRSRPLWRAEDLLERLADDSRLLDEFDMGHRGVAGALRASYLELDSDHRRLFRRLGLSPGEDVDARAAAALCETSEARAAAMLESLADFHLVEIRSPGRYRLHDLVRLYASGLAALEENESDREDAVRRLFDWYLDSAAAACRSRYPGYASLPGRDRTPGVSEPKDAAQAARWLRDERENLLAVARYAGANGHGSVAWRLADTLRGHAWATMSPADFLALGQAALNGARAEQSPEGEAAAELCVSTAYLKARDFTDVARHAERVIEGARGIGWETGQASAHHNMALACWNLGRLRSALEHGEAALAMNRGQGRTRAVSVNLGALGVVHGDMGDLRTERRLHAEALAMAERIGDAGLQASHLRSLSFVSICLGAVEAAETYLDRVVAMEADGIGASTAAFMSRLRSVQGRYDEARSYAETVVRQAELEGDRSSEAIGLTAAASALNGGGRHEEAVAAAARALRVVSGTLRGARIQALIERAVGRMGIDEVHDGEADAKTAVELARAGGYRTGEGMALNLMAEARLRRGEAGLARDLAGRALGLHRRSGHRIGESWSVWVLGTIASREGDATEARRRREEVESVYAEMGVPVPARFRPDTV